jgi:hypothetical protein
VCVGVLAVIWSRKRRLYCEGVHDAEVTPHSNAGTVELCLLHFETAVAVAEQGAAVAEELWEHPLWHADCVVTAEHEHVLSPAVAVEVTKHRNFLSRRNQRRKQLQGKHLTSRHGKPFDGHHHCEPTKSQSNLFELVHCG